MRRENGWFEVRELPNGVFAIMEPYHFQEVISYLITGANKALLFDTGMGVADIRDIVSELCDKELIVVNSHVHFDHVGNNHLFDEVMVFDDDGAKERLKRGYSRSELAPHTKPKLFDASRAGGFDFGNYTIPPSSYKTVADGQIIDLGGRQVKVIHTPGHSPESIMLLDIENKMLFTGDTYYPGPLYAHYEGDFYRESNLEVYADTMEAVCGLACELVSIHPGHNEPSGDPQMLKRAAEALRKLANGEASRGEHLYGDMSVASLPDIGENVEGYIVPDDLYIYEFNGFKIIKRGSDFQ
jgi:glyoxylase-like metal-dependent hydrolase (beta-lactamase superfamily II)